MNYNHVLLSNFPSLLGTLRSIDKNGKDVQQEEYRYSGFVKGGEYRILIENSIEKLFLSLMLYDDIYINDEDFLKVVSFIGVENSTKLLERKLIRIIPRFQNPNVIVHRSKNLLLNKTRYEVEPLMYLGGLHDLDRNYKKYSVNESHRSKIVQYFDNALINKDEIDDSIFIKNMEIIKKEENIDFNNLDYKTTFEILRLYEIVDSLQMQNRHNLSNSIMDNYAKDYLGSKFTATIGKFNNANDKVELFERVSENKRIPNFYQMFKRGSIEIDQILDIRESFNSKLFRNWFANPDVSEQDIYYELLKEHGLNLKINLLKWIVPTIIGVINTPLGVAASSVENFFISKILQGWNPNLFLDNVLGKKLTQLENNFKIQEERKIILERFKGIQRNELCPCQSGKKFKKCHGMN
ncbi:SEC-C domain-containing protein [Acinetobacter radioresistens]|uniref:SEC-C domain-containing protein n=1 Tax=Acinetobacter radioresistens TaxID=40216 RepID=UPI0022479E5F|nr:SEC-C domain-containing protein [Acinetobacter radioresistens]MCX0334026.1 SEC-C domain-containing protein [Acinetobacter radioresistens]